MAEEISIDCGQRLSIDQAEGLYAIFEKALTGGGDLELDASGIHYCDTAGLQMILSLRQTLATTANDIIWKNPSEVLLETAGHLGLKNVLNLTVQDNR